jgi:alpha-amylase/alpha-mannosidase (GH57 family)
MPQMRHPDVLLVLHGHFYQPPRESPWTEEIPEQASAHPYHDWNERIHQECYRPNTASRVLDGYGRIRRIVNNFEHLSFNVGPTLLGWLENAHPEVYARILEADRRSRARRSGHGNAIAQAYNHMILPLANARDRRTQVLWGLRDFELRFGRPADGIWLPETAVDAATVDTLLECGVRFTILSPYQARRVRGLAGGRWHAVSGGRIDPRMPYLVRGSGTDGRGRALAVFFYDGPASRAVAFEQLLRSADTLAERLALVVDPGRESPQLVALAVDGETFGHHEPFGDMCLSAFFSEKAGPRGFRPANFAEVLDALAPAQEVELESGDNGEGTAWSCAHGVGRWVRDCGCSTGAPAGWNQAWRGPLRLALDRLRDAVAELFGRHGGRFLHDPWKARDEYVDVLARRRDPEVLEDFLSRHLKGRVRAPQRVASLALLEAQRHAMSMYTSCGWFFADVTGIETVQNLRYALRCLQLMREFGTEELERRFLADLAEVKSNNGRDTGASIHERWIRPERRTPAHAVVAHAVCRWLGLPHGPRFYTYEVRVLEDAATVVCGRGGRRGHLQLREELTGEEGEYTYLALQFAPRILACFVARGERSRHAQLGREVARLRADLTRPQLERILGELYGAPPLGVGDLLHEERRGIAERLAGERVSGLRASHRAVFDDSLELLRDFAAMRLELPEELRVPCEFSLQADLEEAAQNLGPPFADRDTERLRGILATARELGLSLRLERLARLVGKLLEEQISRLLEAPGAAGFEAANNLLHLAEKLELRIDRTASEERVGVLLERLLAEERSPAPGDERRELLEAVFSLAARLNFAVEEFRSYLAADAHAGS